MRGCAPAYPRAMLNCAQTGANRIQPRSAHLDRARGDCLGAVRGARSCSARWRLRRSAAWRSARAAEPRMPSPCTASRPGRPALRHPTYANPAAPKGGQLVARRARHLRQPQSVHRQGPAGRPISRSYVVESLLARGYDEPFTLYGLIARERRDRRRAQLRHFHASNPAARFSDGKPVTPDDVIFSWQLLRDKGRPNYRIYYKKVAQGRGGRRARRALRSRRRRRPRAAADPRPDAGPGQARRRRRTPSRTRRFAPPLGSGPYTVSEVKPGESVTFTREPDYWGRDLPINRGLWNFDDHPLRLLPRRQHPFRSLQEAASTTSRVETDPGRWQTAYDFPALRDGRVVKEAFPYGLPKGMQGLVFNTRRAGLRRRARARGDPASVRLRMDQPQLISSTSTSAPPAISTAANCPPMAVPANAARARIARRLSRRGARRHHGGQMVAAGHRRLAAATATMLAPRARAVRASRLRLERHHAHAARDRRAARLRDPRHHARPGARWRSPSRAASSAPASTRWCAASTPPSSSAAASPSTST